MRYLFLTSFAVTALATAAFAQGGGVGMLRADTNKDGMISKAEADAEAGQRFDVMDLNKDGFLTADEMKGAGARMLERAGGKVSRADYVARAEQRFARLDTNGDGMLSPDELKAGMQRMRGAMGQRAVDPGDAVAPASPPPPPPAPPPGQ